MLKQAVLVDVDLRGVDMTGVDLDGMTWDRTTSLANIKNLDKAFNVPKGFAAAVQEQTLAAAVLAQGTGFSGWRKKREENLAYIFKGGPKLQ